MTDRLHADEAVIDAALVRTLLARELPEYADLPVRRLPLTGSTNTLFRLGEDLLVRVPRQPRESADIVKEARWIPTLAAHLPCAVPEVVALGSPGPDYAGHWSVVRWIEGTHPAMVGPNSPPRAERTALAEDLAALVAALRATPVPPGAARDPGLRWYRGGTLAALDGTTRENLARCRALPGFNLDLDEAERVWEQALTLPGATGHREHGARHWFHGDLAAENLLVRDGRLHAVLEFGGLAVGDPTIDLLPAWHVLDPPAREAFRRATGVTDAQWLRGRAWALGIALMIWYYWDTMPGRRAAQLTVAANVLADAQDSGLR